AKLQEWLAKRSLAPRSPERCELLYVNAIPLKRDRGDVRLSQVFRFFKPVAVRQVGGFVTRWTEPLGEAGFAGAVGVTAAAAQQPGSPPSAVLQISGRFDADGMAPL